MEIEVEKMKAQYDVKIESCDKMIEHLRKVISENRRTGNEGENESFRKDRAINQAKRQCYVQAKYDFDSLLDYI
jgi:hypothetical protein